MAVSHLELRFLRFAHQQGLLPRRPAILEFGETEILGLDIAAVLADPTLVPDEAARADLADRARRLEGDPLARSFAAAKLLYAALFDPASYTAVDLDGTAQAIKADLNEPLALDGQYDLCINNGTSEHIFNQFQFFKTVHDRTRAGGSMIHWTPTFGWPNHGLYNVQPGFFFDLAHANGYEVLLVCLGTDANMYRLNGGNVGPDLLARHPDLNNALSFALLRKTSDAAFRAPQQGCYRR